MAVPNREPLAHRRYYSSWRFQFAGRAGADGGNVMCPSRGLHGGTLSLSGFKEPWELPAVASVPIVPTRRGGRIVASLDDLDFFKRRT